MPHKKGQISRGFWSFGPMTPRARSITGNHLEDEANDESVQQGKGLLLGGDRTCASVMESTNGHGGGGGCGESQFLVDYVVLAQGNDEEDSKETSRDGQGNEFADIVLRKERE